MPTFADSTVRNSWVSVTGLPKSTPSERRRSTLRGVPSSVSSSIPFFTAERMTDAPLTGRAAMMSASSDGGSASGRQNRMSVSKDMMMRRRTLGTFSSTARAARCAFCSSASMLPLVSRSSATSRDTPSSAPREKTEIGRGLPSSRTSKAESGRSATAFPAGSVTVTVT
jgi:hypothetical protein